MALYVTLAVNEDVIGDIYIQQMAPEHVASPYTVCSYLWRLTVDGEGRYQSGHGLEHRYGDGALALIGKVIELAEATK